MEAIAYDDDNGTMKVDESSDNLIIMGNDSEEDYQSSSDGQYLSHATSTHVGDGTQHDSNWAPQGDDSIDWLFQDDASSQYGANQHEDMVQYDPETMMGGMASHSQANTSSAVQSYADAETIKSYDKYTGDYTTHDGTIIANVAGANLAPAHKHRKKMFNIHLPEPTVGLVVGVSLVIIVMTVAVLFSMQSTANMLGRLFIQLKQMM